MVSRADPPDIADVDGWFGSQAETRLSGAASGYQGQLGRSFQAAIARQNAPKASRDCRFEQVVAWGDEVVGQGLDLRGHESVWLGGVALQGTRVLEYAPGAGCLSSFIAGRSRELVVFDQAPGLPVPVATGQSENPAGLQLLADRLQEHIRNGWWYTRDKLGFAAKVVYGDLEDPPADLDAFDLAVLARVLSTSPNPYRVLAGAARFANTIVVTERLASDDPSETDATRPGIALFRPIPAPDAFRFWWHLTPSAVGGMLRALGFTDQTLTTHAPDRGPKEPFFTIVAHRGALSFAAVRAAMEANDVPLEGLGRILDFGCGSGRVLPYWRNVQNIEVHATDINRAMMDEVGAHFAFVQATTNDIGPPLAYPDGHFGLIYALSVFNHLPEYLQRAWFTELLRVLKPNGLLYFTTNGATFWNALDPEQQDAFDAGEIVVRGAEWAGTERCIAFHPAAWVYSQMFEPTGARLVQYAPNGVAGHPGEDGWLVRK